LEKKKIERGEGGKEVEEDISPLRLLARSATGIRLRFAMIRAFDRVKLVAKVVTLNLKADK